jgi:hypothetical protein
MTKADAVVIAAVEAGVPSLVEARTLIDQFHDMIRKKDERLDCARKGKPRLIPRHGSPQGQSRCACCDHAALVKRPGRSTDYETQTRQTANVRAREN